MAKLRMNGQGWSGVVGTVVLCRWRGIEYMRSLPGYKYDRKSSKQLLQREKLSLCHKFVSSALTTVRIGYATQAIGKSAYNACLSQQMRQAISVENGVVQLDYRKALLGEGPLAVAQQVVCQIEKNQLMVSWNTGTKDGNASVDDKLILVLYDPNRATSLQWQGVALRQDGEVLLTLPSEWIARELHCFMGFQNQKGSCCSNIVHVGEIGQSSSKEGDEKRETQGVNNILNTLETTHEIGIDKLLANQTDETKNESIIDKKEAEQCEVSLKIKAINEFEQIHLENKPFPTNMRVNNKEVKKRPCQRDNTAWHSAWREGKMITKHYSMCM